MAHGFGHGAPFQPLALPSGAAPYPLSFSALGLTGVEGFIFDGSVAGGFFTDAARTTVCVNSGTDPIGGWLDRSGNDSHATQTASAERPVFYSTGTYDYLRTGNIAGQTRRLAIPTLSSLEQATVYVLARDSGGNTSYPLLLVDGTVGWPHGINLIGNNQAISFYDGSSKHTFTYSLLGSSGPIKLVKSGTGTNEASDYICRLLTFTPGPFGETGTFTMPSSNNTGSALGDSDGSSAHYEIIFAFVAATALSAGQQSTIESYILNNTAFQDFCA